jgi:hypothetical protein
MVHDSVVNVLRASGDVGLLREYGWTLHQRQRLDRDPALGLGLERKARVPLVMVNELCRVGLMDEAGEGCVQGHRLSHQHGLCGAEVTVLSFVAGSHHRFVEHADIELQFAFQPLRPVVNRGCVAEDAVRYEPCDLAADFGSVR